MRVPAWMIVVSLAASTWGCGGRDTSPGPAPLQGERRAQDPRSADELALAGAPGDVVIQALQDEHDRAARAAERAWNDAQLARLHEIYGAKPAQMGSVVAGIQLGAKGDWSREPGSAYAQIAPRLGDGLLDVLFADRDGTLTEVTIQLPGELDDEVCAKLEQALTAAWGPSPTKIWHDPTTRQRASLDRNLCMLTFMHYLEPVDWVKALPFTLLGTPVAAAIAATGAYHGSDGLTWHRLGLPTGAGDTELVAFTRSDKVIGLRIYVHADADTVRAVRDALTARLRTKPTMKPDGGTTEWRWSGRVPVELTLFGPDAFSLLIGAI